MGALSANMTLPPRHIDNTPILELIYDANATDEYYIGAIVCKSQGATEGRVVVDNADADDTLGICLERVSAVAGTLVRVHVKGVWWIACTNFETADLLGLFAPAVASDNPADLDDIAIGTPSALGTLIHVGTTAVDGYIDLDRRVVAANPA